MAYQTNWSHEGRVKLDTLAAITQVGLRCSALDGALQIDGVLCGKVMEIFRPQ